MYPVKKCFETIYYNRSKSQSNLLPFVFRKLTLIFFSRSQISTCSLASNIQSDNTVICRCPVANWKALFVLLPRSNQVVRYTVTLHCDRIMQNKNRPGLVKNFKFLWLAPKHCYNKMNYVL